jgi:predicted DNA-binding transcriptional regulator AlpA
MNLPEPLWKVGDVAQFLSMSVSWVYKEAEAGRLPCVRIGAALRFSPDVIRRYLANLQVGTNVRQLRTSDQTGTVDLTRRGTRT